jgi:hypothetical protein
MFVSRQVPAQVKNLSGVPVKGKLIALLLNLAGKAGQEQTLLVIGPLSKLQIK